jgi:carbamate kinase
VSPTPPGVAVVAFGGNALLPKGERGTDSEQRARARAAAGPLAALTAAGWGVVLVHGNGPQVGNLLIQQDVASTSVPPYHLDVCVAATQGTLGFLIEEALRSELAREGLETEIVTLLTLAVVSPLDAAFANPSKPVGPYLTEQRARYLRMVRHVPVVHEEKRGYRKVVASPEPLELLPRGTFTPLLQAGCIVNAGGGGGIPVVRRPDGSLEGVEAVVDKDRTALLVAREVGATDLVFLTEVPAVYLDYGQEGERALGEVRAGELRQHMDDGHFPAGSMGPKVRSALDFLEGGGRRTIVTDLANLEESLEDRAGTRILP